MLAQNIIKMSESRFNGIVILDAVPEGELNTARRLKEDLKDISCYVANGLQVRYVRIDTTYALRVGISEILDEIKNNGLNPWLHLDGHGLSDQSGFQLSGGTACSWVQLKELITPLNIALGLNLVLILSTCFGGSFASAIRTVDRAPVLGLIGPTREVTIGEIERAFPAFYRTFFESLSLKKAIDALNTGAPKGLYYRTTATQFFYDVWASYKKVQCTEEEIENRARRMYREAKKQNLPRTPSIGQLKRLLRSQESRLFEKYRDTYFMYDIDELNRDRFPVTYIEAESYAMR
jgi:hypothetical protein